MNNDRKPHQQNLFDGTGLFPKRNWRTALVHIALLAVVIFLTEISAAKADMVFDFQMKLAEKGNAEAQFKVGEMYETGRGVDKNLIEAKRWITKAAAQGHEAAGYKLLYYDVQNNGVTADNKAALSELQQAAKSGNGHAQYYVGLMYSRGVGVKQNSAAALDWLGKASLVGVTAAEAEIAYLNSSRQAQMRAQREAEEQARAEQARRKEEERKKLEAQRAAEQRKQQNATARQKAEEDRKLAQQREAERKAAEETARKQQLIAQREAEAEKKRKAVLEQRKKKDAEKKAQFESDPCAGKSARFLSTCR